MPITKNNMPSQFKFKQVIMGNSCTRCNCNIFEGDESEMVVNEYGAHPKLETALSQKGRPVLAEKKLNCKKEADVMKYIKGSCLQKIIRLQAFWKGYEIRRVIKYLKATQKSFIKYFTQEEAKETLSKNIYNPNQILEKRKPYKYQSGAVYAGEWRGGFREGYGEIIWLDGAVYRGTWKHGRAHGKGIFYHADGDIYEGQWAYDKANGYGKYTHENGATYEGYWKDDVQHGRGKEEWADEANYDGEYSYGKKHGYGIYCWNDGSKYSGEWDDNNISGKGIYEWNDGRKFAGEWKNNNMNGFGIYCWPGGRKYVGSYTNDNKQGYGKYIWQDGRIFQGWWIENKQHGLGVYSVPGEEKKYGLWEKGRRIIWFSSEQVQKITQGLFDYSSFFSFSCNEKESEAQTSFDPPISFEHHYESLKEKFPEAI